MHHISKDPRYGQAVHDIATHIMGIYDSVFRFQHGGMGMAQALSPERLNLMEAEALRAGESAMRGYAKIRRGFKKVEWLRKQTIGRRKKR